MLLVQHRDLEARRAAASAMSAALGLTIPQLVDAMDDAASHAFAAWPERIFIIDADGRLAYCGARGPWGFAPDEARAALEAMLA